MLRKLAFMPGIIVPGALLLAACGGSSSDSSSSNESVSPVPVTIEFEATVNDVALACDTAYTNVGTAATTVQIKDFRMFVHGVELITTDQQAIPLNLDSNVWQAQGVALLDFEDATGACTGTAETHTALTGTIPGDAADITGIRFTVGIPENLNHLEQAGVSPFNVTGMNWGWTNGFKFIRFDIENWNVHVGATGCVADINGDVSCSNANRPQIQFDNFDYQTQRIRIDYAALVQASDVSTDTGGAVGCMSGGTDPECNDVFTQLGLNLATGDNDSGLVQTVFSVAN